jgi:hypothetical protein
MRGTRLRCEVNQCVKSKQERLMKKLNSMTDDRSVPVVIHVAKQLAELLELPQDAKLAP